MRHHIRVYKCQIPGYYELEWDIVDEEGNTLATANLQTRVPNDLKLRYVEALQGLENVDVEYHLSEFCPSGRII